MELNFFLKSAFASNVYLSDAYYNQQLINAQSTPDQFTASLLNKAQALDNSPELKRQNTVFFRRQAHSSIEFQPANAATNSDFPPAELVALHAANTVKPALPPSKRGKQPIRPLTFSTPKDIADNVHHAIINPSGPCKFHPNSPHQAGVCAVFKAQCKKLGGN